MILKSYEITNINLHKNNLVLFYGKNEALKDQLFKKDNGKYHLVFLLFCFMFCLSFLFFWFLTKVVP